MPTMRYSNLIITFNNSIQIVACTVESLYKVDLLQIQVSGSNSVTQIIKKTPLVFSIPKNIKIAEAENSAIPPRPLFAVMPLFGVNLMFLGQTDNCKFITDKKIKNTGGWKEWDKKE